MMNFKKKQICILAIFALLVILSILSVSALNNTSTDQTNSSVTKLYFFWGDGCPHCAHEKPFLEDLQDKYPQLEINSYETWHDRDNAKLFTEMAEAFGTRASGVPATFIDNKVWIGYADYIGDEIEAKVKYCADYGCVDAYEKITSPAVADAEIITSSESSSSLELVCMHYFMHGECPQCNDSTPYIESLAEKYNIELKIHDVSIPEEMEAYGKFKETYGLMQASYPIIFIGNRFIVGESAIKDNLEAEIISCKDKNCICPAEKVQGLAPYPPKPEDITPEESNIVKIPIIGEVDLTKMSMPVLTIILAGLDSFNPCAFFVLFFLLSMLIYARSRKRMFLIGSVFIFFSGLIYFLFMSAWLNLFLFIGEIMIITTIAGVIALIVAGINIKDFFFFEKGVSLVIPEKAKPGLFKRMRNLLKATSIPSMLIGTIILAIASNSYELLCTAGFPMVFTRALTLNNMSTFGYYFYIFLYNVIYVIPLLIIVLFFTITLGAKKLTEWQGQILKLISGLMMLCLGLVLLIKPALLNNVLVAIGLLATALATAGIIIFITKRVRKKHAKNKGGVNKNVNRGVDEDVNGEKHAKNDAQQTGGYDENIKEKNSNGGDKK